MKAEEHPLSQEFELFKIKAANQFLEATNKLLKAEQERERQGKLLIQQHDKIGEQANTIAGLNRKISELEETVAALKKELSDTKANLGRAYNGIDHRNATIQALQLELKNLSKEIK